MAERAAKKKEEKAPAEVKTLEQLILDRKIGKYSIVALISFWAKELRKLEEHRHLTQNEILELAMAEVLSGKVSEKELAAKLAQAEANGHSEEDKKNK